jgi:hypothetical protein
MKWIQPGSELHKVRVCKFCGKDVSTPFKGVHDETEIFNGLPIPCRNNGRMNADIAFPEFAKLHKQPVEGTKYFVEHKETKLWWSGYQWTKDPLEVFGCDLPETADRYARLQLIENYEITEHIFL